MLNYVTKPKYHDAVTYEIKALNCRIEGLREDLGACQSEDNFWNGYVLTCMQIPIGAKKDTDSRQTTGI